MAAEEVIAVVNAYRLEVVRTRLREPQAAINSTYETAARYAYLERYDRERFIRVDLDSRNRVIGEEVVSIGTVNSALVSPREVFKGAILNNAVHIIMVHNHPGGSAEPSAEDLKVNEVLCEAGTLLGIPVADFVIIGEDGKYWSSGSGEARAQSTLERTPEKAPVGRGGENNGRESDRGFGPRNR